MAGFKAGDRTSRAARRLIRMALAASLGCLALAAFSVLRAPAQVLTVSQSKIDGQYLDFHPTNVPLPTQPLDSQTRQELIRIMDAEQGFAMRPLPKGTHGI